MIPPIYIAFTLLSALLLWFVIGARGKWQIKLPMILLVPAFMFVVWQSLGSFSGWPTTDAPPKTAYYIYGYVIEPDANYHIKGAVYVWLIPGTTKHGTFDYAPKYGEPRAYKLPFSKKLEQQIQSANAAVGHGKQVGFSTQPPAQGKKGKTGHKAGGGAYRKGTFHFYNLRAIPTTKAPGQ